MKDNQILIDIINEEFNNPPEERAAVELLNLGCGVDDVKNLDINDAYRIPVCNAMRDLIRKRP